MTPRVEKYWYLTVSLRTDTLRYRFIFEYRFVSSNKTSYYLLAPPRTANLMTHHVLIPAEKVPDSVNKPHCLEYHSAGNTIDCGGAHLLCLTSSIFVTIVGSVAQFYFSFMSKN